VGYGIDERLILSERVVTVRAKAQANAERLQETRSRLQELRDQTRAGRSRREMLHESALARLMARLESLPVIEQAKGILMAQNGCGPDEAFDMLRRASQRTNTPVRELAAEIVRRTVARGRDDRRSA
jgi:ANTAR domain-containing protein